MPGRDQSVRLATRLSRNLHQARVGYRSYSRHVVGFENHSNAWFILGGSEDPGLLAANSRGHPRGHA